MLAMELKARKVNHESRAYSEELSLSSVAVKASPGGGGSTILPNKSLELKRTLSVPVALVVAPSKKPSAASQRPQFKIEIPSWSFFRGPAPSSNLFRCYRASSVPSPTIRRRNTTRLDQDHCLQLNADEEPSICNNTALLTPPDENTMNDRKLVSSTPNPPSSPPAIDGESKFQDEKCPVKIATYCAGREHRPIAGDHKEHFPADSSILSGRSVSELGTSKECEDSPSSWLESVVNIVVSDISASAFAGSTVRVLAQALPSPIAEAPTIAPTTAFPSLICGLQLKLQTNQTSYIQIVHAVPTGFPLTHLPTSPPVTPGTAELTASNDAQEDYFNTSVVYSSAVAVINRHEKFLKHTLAPSLNSSPCLAVPPCTIDFALLERYIPPSTAEEVNDLFTLTGPSAVVDRLIELRPGGGTLLFIYPTKVGAQIFTKQHLGPILDPVLRNIIFTRGLSADIGINVSKIAAVDHLLEFEAMKGKINNLLLQLNDPQSKQQWQNGNYALVHSSKEAVHIERNVWTEWFVKQETPRIRQITTEYFNRTTRLPQDQHTNYAVLTREIVEGLAKREYGEEGEPGKDAGIEVGIFVVRRGV